MSLLYFDDPFFGSDQRDIDFEDFKQTAIKSEELEVEVDDKDEIVVSLSVHATTMQKMTSMHQLDDQENIDPRQPDRAKKVLRDVGRDMIHGTNVDRNSKNDNLDAVDSHSPSRRSHPYDLVPPIATTASTQTLAQLTPGSSPGSRDQSTAHFSVNTTPDPDASGGDSDEPIILSPKKSQLPLKHAKKRKAKASTPDEPLYAGREGLRTRTPAQQNPFKADKVAYSLIKSRGRNPSKAEIDRKLEQDAKAAPSKASRKKAKQQDTVEDETASESLLVSSSPSATVDVLNDDYKRQHTILRITVADPADGGIEVRLARFVCASEGSRAISPLTATGKS
jgi:hypothetical protein